MTQPGKVIGFLDIAGAWDPSLLIVMGSAVAVYAAAYRLSRRLRAPALAPSFPDARGGKIDARLLAGAALFGVGWGLGGFCPGPALVSSVSGMTNALIFVPAMAVGMMLVALFRRGTPAA
jgi:uncharacterized membrane protein YedE/YeeE